MSPPRLLVLELWGLGDLTFATAFLRAAAPHWRITLVGKAHAQALLEPSFPEVEFVAFDAPWTAFEGKYRLWHWPWRALGGLLRRLRVAKFDAAVSVRADPRDHLLMRLAGARRRLGFPSRGSALLLTEKVRRTLPVQHRVEDWRDLAAQLLSAKATGAEPWLDHARYRSARVDHWLAGVAKPVVCLHAGARIAVRRWPEEYFVSLVRALRARFDFRLLLIPDPDGYGSGIAAVADEVIASPTLGELVDLLGRADLVLCNDSGPGHLAASCGRPVIAIFGPTEPAWFRPWGEQHRVIIRDLCPLRPCFDYCVYPEPYCLTLLRPGGVEEEVCQHLERLIGSGVLPKAMLPAHHGRQAIEQSLQPGIGRP